MSNPALAGANLAVNALGPLGAEFIAGHGANKTVPVTTPYSLYSLALRSPGPVSLPVAIYTFPLSPQQITMERAGMGNLWDTQGNAGNFGVSRKVDMYGLAPPIYNIAGTTGVKLHSRDGFLWSGLQSVQILQGIIAQFFSLNSALVQNGQTSLFRLEFYDFYLGEFWEIVPLGPQGIIQNARSPQLVFYRFRFVATQSLEQPISQLVDPLLQALTTPISSVFSSLNTGFNSLLGSYSANSP